MPKHSSNRLRIVWKALKNCTKETKAKALFHDIIESKFFEVPFGRKSTEWTLCLFPSDSDNPTFVDLNLILIEGFKLQFIIEFTFFIIGKSGRHCEASFCHSTYEFGDNGLGAEQFFTFAKFDESFDEFVVDGTLKLCCEITISPGGPKSSPVPSIFKNIQGMYDDELLKDFELRCSDGKTLKCHKFILAARSPVFRAMLSNDMQEAREGFAEVPDFGSEVMTEVLRFIYGFAAGNLDTIAKDLTFAAEKYDLDDLKQTCIKKIAEKSSKDCVDQALLMGDVVSGSDKDFQKCIAGVVGNFVETSMTSAWTGLPDDILTKIVYSTIRMASIETEHID